MVQIQVDRRRLIAQSLLDLADREQEAWAKRRSRRSMLGDGIGPGTGGAVATGAASGIVGGPLGIAAGAVGGLFSSLFGGDGDLGPETPGVVNPETGKTVHCGKPDETARTQLLANGDTGWIWARMPTGNYYATNNTPLPFPNARRDEKDKVDANIFSYLYNSGAGNPGQCPDMTRVAGEQLARLKLKIARSVAKPEMFSSIGAYNQFMGITTAASSQLQTQSAIGQAASTVGQLNALQQDVNGLSPQDQAAMQAIMRARGLNSGAGGILDQMAAGNVSSDMNRQLMTISQDVSHLNQVIAGLRSQAPEVRAEAIKSIDALMPSGMMLPLAIGGGVLLFATVAVIAVTAK